MRNRSSISIRAIIVLGPPVIVHLVAVIFWNLQRAQGDVWCSKSINDYCNLTPASSPLDYSVAFYLKATSAEWWWYHFSAFAFSAVASVSLLALYSLGAWVFTGKFPRVTTKIADWFDYRPVDLYCTDKDCPCATHQNQTFVTKWQPRS